MPYRLPDNVKTPVIQQWLAGHPRDKIAIDCGISTGAVSNIVNEWKMALDTYRPDSLRDLGISLNRIGISHAQCAVGFRVVRMLRSFGVQEDKFECFIADLQNRCCNELGLPLDRIGFYIANLAELSDNVPISDIPNYISQRVDEKREIEQKIKELEGQIEELQTRKSELENRTVCAVQNHAITEEKLDWYSRIKEQLEKYGILVDDISKVVVIVNNVAKLFGYDNQKIVDALSNLQTLKNEYEFYEGLVQFKRNECSSLQNMHSRLKEDVESCKQTLDIYAKLFDMGFGLKELKLLWHTIYEIADANNIPREDAIKKFFKDVEDHYDDKLGFESKIYGLKEEVDNLSQQKRRLFAELGGYPKLASALAKLLDIFYSRDNNNNNGNFEELDLLVDQVRMAGGIKAAKEKLSSQPIVVALAALASHSSVLLSNNKTNNNNYDGEIKNSSSNSWEIEEREKLPLQNSFNNHAIQNAEDTGPKKCYKSIRPLKHTSLSFFSFITSFSILIMLSLSARNRALERLKENEQYNNRNNAKT